VDRYEAATYGDRIAEIYDQWPSGALDPTSAVTLLVELAPGGRALELGVGTGRVALPLAARGVEVVGIDASEEMVAKLRAKPGGAAIDVVIGDFADVAAPGTFDMVYVAFNTFFALLTQDAQIRCLGNVAAKLRDGGRLVLECFVPDMGRFDRHQTTRTTRVTTDEVHLDTSLHDPVAQRIDSAHVVMGARGVALYPVAIRYAWPAELDAMALVAGLVLEHRYADYDRRPFTRDSPAHVSVYRRR